MKQKLSNSLHNVWSNYTDEQLKKRYKTNLMFTNNPAKNRELVEKAQKKRLETLKKKKNQKYNKLSETEKLCLFIMDKSKLLKNELFGADKKSGNLRKIATLLCNIIKDNKLITEETYNEYSEI